MTLDENGIATFDPEDLNNGSLDNCSAELDFSVDENSFTCSLTTRITCRDTFMRDLVVTDLCGNSNSCSAIIFISNSPPTAQCKDLTISVDTDGAANILATDLDDGSSDNCTAPSDLVLTASRTSFDCDDLICNENQSTTLFNVTLTVTNECGLFSSCNSEVTLQDIEPPTARCTETL